MLRCFLLISTWSILSIGFLIASIVPTARFAQPIGSFILYPMIGVSGPKPICRPRDPILGPGDFLGEGCLAGQSNYLVTATTISPTSVLVIERNEMIRALHEEHEFSDRFIAYMLGRNIRVEADLIDQLFNSSEKRLARTLLLLARYGAPGHPHKALPKVSQEMLAEMIGTTRSRVNFFMNKFRKLGFIQYNGEIQVNDSLLSVVLHD
jgi:CRP/FNR family transcriptional regulator, cyclic AMP receptor protein